MIHKRLVTLGFVTLLGAGTAAALLLPPSSFAAQQTEDTGKKPKDRVLSWKPPNTDAPIPALSSSPPCVLADVLALAGARTIELVTDLQSFTAQERIEFRSNDRQGFVLEEGSDTVSYTVTFPHQRGHPVVEENRAPLSGNNLSEVARAVSGLPEMVFIFLPTLQGDYEMNCEGMAEWKGKPAWVVDFKQRPDKPERTSSFHTRNITYPASLKGHAWIAADSGEVVHLETGLMKEIPPVKLHQWFVVIDYVPVKFPTQDVTIWLPEFADSYYDFGSRRMMIYHTFANFMLFWTQTNLKIEKPKQP
ncbi:MAG TPA: hypothetical protein VKR82_11310 [Candidatus Acidoferrales bacterium]|nr:hypothetical protein [Candidatus Acidoferrales bacterium]